jgi:hypothetical protein
MYSVRDGRIWSSQKLPMKVLSWSGFMGGSLP